jgi:cation diffusion facilitator CzcD-associated flavoprotein CzcO
MSIRNPRVAVIGAGMSGICMGLKLQQAGVTDLTLFEKGESVGGTWRENQYPGITCDVPSRYYQYTFAPNPEWTQFTPAAQEIHRYFIDVTKSHGLEPHIRFSSEVTDVLFADGTWTIRTKDGYEGEFDFVIAAVGVLHHPFVPEIEGMDSFAGPMFHSTRWDHSVPLDGKRVAVIGTGSTGVQIVSALAPVTSELYHFQRTVQWVLPLPNWKFSRVNRWLMRRFPKLNVAAYRMWQATFGHMFSASTVYDGWERALITRLCRWHLKLVRDPELRKKLTPDYKPMCKRMVMSPYFYRAVQRPNVEVVTDGIQRIEPGGVRTVDGELRECDVIALATGFQAHRYLRPMNVVGKDGRTLDDHWPVEPKAYRSVALAGFPNFFMINGPHCPIGNIAMCEVAETVSSYIIQWIGMYQQGVFDTAAPTDEAEDAYNAEIRAQFPGETIWASGGCQSWYFGADGIPNLWPSTAKTFRQMLSAAHVDEFELTKAPAPVG